MAHKGIALQSAIVNFIKGQREEGRNIMTRVTFL